MCNLAAATRIYPTDEVGQWATVPSRLEADEPVRGGIALLENAFDIQRGIVLEGSMQIHQPPKRWSGIGVYVEQNAEAQSGTGILLQTRGCTEAHGLDVHEIAASLSTDYDLIHSTAHLKLYRHRTQPFDRAE